MFHGPLIACGKQRPMPLSLMAGKCLPCTRCTYGDCLGARLFLFKIDAGVGLGFNFAWHDCCCALMSLFVCPIRI